MEAKLNIRAAQPNEAGLVLEFIKKLAVYEKCADEVVADESTLYRSLFEEHSAEVVFAEEDGVVVGFALFFHNFSTFVGRKGLYLEDLFILPEKRGKGYGKALLKYLAKLAVERNCGRMEWICLDWNQPALKVYRSIGAVPMDEWTVQRLDEEPKLNKSTLRNLLAKGSGFSSVLFAQRLGYNKGVSFCRARLFSTNDRMSVKVRSSLCCA